MKYQSKKVSCSLALPNWSPMSVHMLNCNTGSGGACSSTIELPQRRPPPRCAFASSSSAPRAPSAVLLVRLLVGRNRGCRNQSSSSLARAPARASRASAASPTPPKSAPYAIAFRINIPPFVCTKAAEPGN
ncbi:hypothetical protein EJB05_56388 [Eragrostis curvula]|uniref:Uncharacterized protein n=1 Tax=Eragrostis curvula TaxID=38414 RepID=A0A5J9SHM7_9POAL|nr:hypothetical protein EJB05_56388 [Eragrostis curvula]